jgi:hypothetical protein
MRAYSFLLGLDPRRRAAFAIGCVLVVRGPYLGRSEPPTRPPVRVELSITTKTYCVGDARGDWLHLGLRVRVTSTSDSAMIPSSADVVNMFVKNAPDQTDAEAAFSMPGGDIFPPVAPSTSPKYEKVTRSHLVTFDSSTFLPVARAPNPRQRIVGPGSYWLVVVFSPPFSEKDLGPVWNQLTRNGPVWVQPVRSEPVAFKVEPDYTARRCDSR